MEKYEKPKMLSDPFGFWEGKEGLLQKIADKPTESLTAYDYSIIYHYIAPAASYSEGVYYLDQLWLFLAKSHEIPKSSYPDGLLRWLKRFNNNLVNDGLWEKCIAKFTECVDTLFSSFSLHRLTEAAPSPSPSPSHHITR